MSKLSLSFSQVTTFLDCQRKWYLDKVEKVRPSVLGSALYFGTSTDNSIEHILLKKEGHYLETFDKLMNNFEVNRKPKKLPEDILALKFFVSDLDPDLVDQDFMDEVCEKLEVESITIPDFLDFCKQQRKSKTELGEIEQSIFNFLAQRSLETKGKLILEKLEEWITENVVEVHSVQKKIELENDNGDKFIGYHDFIVTLKDGKKYLIDLKTSSDPNKYYPEDSASNSPQLAIYSLEEDDLDGVAYLVGDKKIRKKEPRARIHFVKGEISEEVLDKTFLQIEEVTGIIKEKLPFGKGVFDQNKEACSMYGGCSYRDYCWKGSMKGLEKV